jgi:hypothetical protein
LTVTDRRREERASDGERDVIAPEEVTRIMRSALAKAIEHLGGEDSPAVIFHAASERPPVLGGR